MFIFLITSMDLYENCVLIDMILEAGTDNGLLVLRRRVSEIALSSPPWISAVGLLSVQLGVLFKC